MARIKEYTTQVGAAADIGGRRAQGSDFYIPGNDGSALMDAADRIGDVVQKQEVSDVRANMAEKRAKWTVELKNRADSGDLGDATFAEKFNEDFANDVSSAGDNVRTPAGRAAYKESAALMSAHFVEASGLYQAESMGKKAVFDYSRALDANRNTLIQDPSQFQNVLVENEQALADKSGPYANMPAAVREKLQQDTRKELAMSAVQGEIAQNPNVALARLNGGTWGEYLDADKTVQLKRSAEIAINAREIESNRLQVAANKARVEAERKTEDSFVTQLVKDPTSLSAVDIANSKLNPDDKIKWLSILKSGATEKPLKTDGGTFTELFQRIQLPPDDPRAITDEKQLDPYLGSGLNMEGLNQLRTEVSGRRTEDGRMEADMRKTTLDGIKSSLTGSDPLLRIRDPKGDENYARFMAYFLPEYARQRKAGKTPVQLLDPDSPDYLGKAAERFKRSPQQMMHDLINNNAGNPNAPLGAPLAAAEPGTSAFNPESEGYDYDRAKAAGLGPDGTGENKGHWGSVAPTTAEERRQFKLPEESYVILKGRKHETWDKAVAGEKERGFEVVKRGNRYYSIPGFKSAEDVTKAYREGAVSREDASRILRENGWAN